MIAFSIAGGVALFLLIVVLLLSLNLYSVWRWWVKAAATVVSVAAIGVFYVLMTSLLGWASGDAPPARFNLLHTRIVEPDKKTGAPGHIYLWVEQVDDRQIVTGPPRAFEVPYTPATAQDVSAAQQKVDGGGKILGESVQGGQPAGTKKPSETPDSSSTQANAGNANLQHEGGGGEGAETLRNAVTLSFSEMPVVDLPDKSKEPPQQ